MEKDIPMYVTTDSDLWNSADEAHFFVTKGQVKRLPEVLTSIIEDGLSQGLLREASPEEISKQQFNDAVENAVVKKQIVAGKTYNDTVKAYQEYVSKQEEKKMEEERDFKTEVAQKDVEPEAPVENTQDEVKDSVSEETPEEVKADTDEDATVEGSNEQDEVVPAEEIKEAVDDEPVTIEEDVKEAE